MALFHLDLAHLLWDVPLILFCAVVWQHLFSPLKAFPGPWAAKFTNIWRAVAVAKGDFDATNRKWHAQYGAAVRIGPNTISISDAALIKTIYATRNPWLKSDMYKVNDALVGKQTISNIFNTRDNEWHEQQVKPIRPFFSMTKLQDVEPLIDETLDKLMTKLEVGFVGGQNAGKTCMIDDWMAWFSWDAMTNITFGRHVGFLDEQVDMYDLIEESRAGVFYFAPISQIPWLDRLLDKNLLIRLGPKPTVAGVTFAQRAIAEHHQQAGASKDASARRHFLNKYLQLRAQAPEKVDDGQLVQWLLPNVLAGGDTTAATLRAVVYFLAKHPAAYTKLVAELDKAARVNAPVVSWRTAKDLPYLDAVVREAMRLCPGIALVFERVVPPGAGLALPDGRVVPAGTKVGLNPGVTNRDAAVFGADVDAFVPERWLRRDEGRAGAGGGARAEAEAETTRLRRMHDVLDFVFSAGSRVCLGKYLAKLEIYKTIATLYARFDIKLVDPAHDWKYHDAWFIYQWDMPMKLTRRVVA